MSRLARRQGACAIAATVIGAGVVLAPAVYAQGPAAVPGFKVNACAGREDPHGAAFADFKTRSMVTKRACLPYGRGIRGLVLAVQHSGKRGARVGRGSVARFVVAAPPGTAITDAAWSGEAVRSDCGFRMDVFAQAGPRSWGLYDVRKCPPPGRALTSGDKRVAHASMAANRVVLRVICTKASCSRRGRNYLRTSSVALRVEDVQDPTVTITNVPGGWVNGTQTLSYRASDNAGLSSVAPSAKGTADDFTCQLITPTPCPREVADQVGIETAQLPEGTQGVRAVARDVSGRIGASELAPLHIDRTAPPRIDTSLAGGDGWRSTSSFGLSWTNQPEPDRAPIAAARYQLCPASGSGACTSDQVPGDGISSLNLTLPSPGEWNARVWREDAAGNQSQDLASVPVRLRWDPSPPEVAFDPSSPSDPTRVSVRAADAVSGVASGVIEISRSGSGVWQELPTSLDGDHLRARVDDATRPTGAYDFRARAVDLAGNERSAVGPSLHLPLRTAARIDAGRRALRSRRVRVGKGRKRHTVTRRAARFAPKVTIGFRRSRILRGLLRSDSGAPIQGPVAVFERDATGTTRLGGVTMADTKGRFAYRARGTRSRELVFAYPGTGVIRPASATVQVSVPGTSTIRSSKHRLLNGRATTFSGRVMTSPIPTTGKLVALQAKVGHIWRTFRTLRTDGTGRWRSRYRFTSTCERRKRWQIRAAIPAEDGVPFSSGHSHPASVVVRGNGSCR